MFGKFQRITFRLPTIIVFLVAVVALSIGTYSYLKSSEELHRQVKDELVALRDARHAALTQYFRSIEEDLELLSTNGLVISALNDFHEAFGRIDNAQRYREEQKFRKIYSPNNINGNRSALKQNVSPVIDEYFHAHNKHHQWLERTTTLKGFYDLFLITPRGDVVYTMSKEKDFATNLQTGEWSDTGLAKAFKQSLGKRETQSTSFVDFQPYKPSNDAPAAFIARKIIQNGRTIGVLSLQMPINRINAVMQVTAGMGESGETYVVGPGHFMHSDSRFSGQSTILKTKVNTVSAIKALGGEHGVAIIDDYRGIQVVSAFRPFEFLDATWALLAEKDVAEIQAPINAMRNSIIFIGLGLTLLVTASGMVLAGSITRPLAGLSKSIRDFQHTHHIDDLPQLSRRDEIGDIARGFHTAANSISEYISSINHANEELKQKEHEVREREERIRSLLDVSPIGFTLARMNGTLLLTNDAFRDILRLPRGTLETPNIEKVYKNPADREHYVNTLLRDQSVSGYEIEWVRGDGSPCWVRISSKLIEYDGEQVILAWIDDVSERKIAEQELAHKTAALEITLETMDQGITMVDGGLNVITYNELFLDLLELPPGRFVPGANLAEFFRFNAERGEYGDGDVEEQIQTRLELAGKFEAHRFERTRPDGMVIEIRGNPLPNDQGFVTTYTDITDRKQAEEKIAAKEAQLRMAMENMPGAMVVVDQGMKIVLVNDTYKEFYGDPDGLVAPNKSMCDLLKSEISRGMLSGDGTPEEIYEERIASYHADEIQVFEDRTPNGQFIQLTRTPAPNRHTISVAVDISDRKLAEDNLTDAYGIISSSINYASHIQRSILPPQTAFTKIFKDSFVIWEPRDVVGGDIYWNRKWGDGRLIVLADCTGHGVPGAFVTLIATGALERAMEEVPAGDVGKLINRMHRFVQRTLGQHTETGHSDDGLELGACFLNPDQSEMVFSGARFSLFLLDKDAMSEVKGDKNGIGYRGIPSDVKFTNSAISLEQGQCFYMSTDGLIDQVGGDKRRAFGKRRFKELISSMVGQTFSRQKKSVLEALKKHQGAEIRRDDVSAIGFQIQ